VFYCQEIGQKGFFLSIDFLIEKNINSHYIKVSYNYLLYLSRTNDTHSIRFLLALKDICSNNQNYVNFDVLKNSVIRLFNTTENNAKQIIYRALNSSVKIDGQCVFTKYKNRIHYNNDIFIGNCLGQNKAILPISIKNYSINIDIKDINTLPYNDLRAYILYNLILRNKKKYISRDNFHFFSGLHKDQQLNFEKKYPSYIVINEFNKNGQYINLGLSVSDIPIKNIKGAFRNKNGQTFLRTVNEFKLNKENVWKGEATKNAKIIKKRLKLVTYYKTLKTRAIRESANCSNDFNILNNLGVNNYKLHSIKKNNWFKTYKDYSSFNSTPIINNLSTTRLKGKQNFVLVRHFNPNNPTSIYNKLSFSPGSKYSMSFFYERLSD